MRNGVHHLCEQLLSRMIAIPSVNPEFGGTPEGQALLAGFLSRTAVKMGLAVRWLGPSSAPAALLVEHRMPGAREWLLFDSHLDTVAEGDDPRGRAAPVLVGGRIYGRGACDTKGSGAAMLCALGRLRVTKGRRPLRNIGLLFTWDEEAGMTGARTTAPLLAARYGKAVRGIIVGEPTGLIPVVAHNGLLRWKTETIGKAGHSSEPWRGWSAIQDMVALVQAMEKELLPSAFARHPLTGPGAATITQIKGGTQINVIPDRCRIACDWRMLPVGDWRKILRLRNRLSARVCKERPGMKIKHHPPYVVPPLDPGREARIPDWLVELAPHRFSRLRAHGAGYATHAGIYAAAGFPAVVLGPGLIRHAHRPKESVSRAQLKSAVDLYFDLMSGPCRPAG